MSTGIKWSLCLICVLWIGIARTVVIGEPTKREVVRAVENFGRTCTSLMTDKEVEPLEQALRDLGPAAFDPLIKFAKDKGPATCRGVVILIVADIARENHELISRAIRELSPLANDLYLGELPFQFFAAFGELANDELILLLESPEERVRMVAVAALKSINKEQIATNRELWDYDGRGSQESRSKAASSWRDWWMREKHRSCDSPKQ